METSELLRDALKTRSSDLEFFEYRVQDLVLIPEFQYYETLDKLDKINTKCR